jgi:hypothetical protein
MKWWQTTVHAATARSACTEINIGAPPIAPHKSPQIPVGAKLAREGDRPANNDVECTGLFASKLRSYRGMAVPIESDTDQQSKVD